MSGAGQNKEGNSLNYPLPSIRPLPPTHRLKASGKADDYYNLNQSFKAATYPYLPPPDSLLLPHLCLVLVWYFPYFPATTHIYAISTSRGPFFFIFLLRASLYRQHEGPIGRSFVDAASQTKRGPTPQSSHVIGFVAINFQGWGVSKSPQPRKPVVLRGIRVPADRALSFCVAKFSRHRAKEQQFLSLPASNGFNTKTGNLWCLCVS